MINSIKLDKDLSPFIDDTCCENEVCVTFEEGIDETDYVILKVDKYYNSLNIKRPASVDCLIIRKCVESGYGLTLVELKNISSSKGFTLDNMREKFETTLNEFIKKIFRKQLDYNYSDVKLYFVTNQEIYKRDLGLKMELLINTKFSFNERKIMITPRMPNPAIKNCY